MLSCDYTTLVHSEQYILHAFICSARYTPRFEIGRLICCFWKSLKTLLSWKSRKTEVDRLLFSENTARKRKTSLAVLKNIYIASFTTLQYCTLLVFTPSNYLFIYFIKRTFIADFDSKFWLVGRLLGLIYHASLDAWILRDRTPLKPVKCRQNTLFEPIYRISLFIFVKAWWSSCRFESSLFLSRLHFLSIIR